MFLISSLCVAALLWIPAPLNSVVTSYANWSLSQRTSLVSLVLKLQPPGQMCLLQFSLLPRDLLPSCLYSAASTMVVNL